MGAPSTIDEPVCSRGWKPVQKSWNSQTVPGVFETSFWTNQTGSTSRAVLKKRNCWEAIRGVEAYNILERLTLKRNVNRHSSNS